ncbi:hypothetical protein KFA89_004898, partial [Escherichia coli]|nr:hypothetical protein [Escherichia coli]
DRNRSHWSTSKTPSYTKSVSWQHHPGFHINEPMLPESLASDIYETLHSEKLEQIANNGKKYVLENYLWWQVTHKFENVLENWFR